MPLEQLLLKDNSTPLYSQLTRPFKLAEPDFTTLVDSKIRKKSPVNPYYKQQNAYYYPTTSPSNKSPKIKFTAKRPPLPLSKVQSKKVLHSLQTGLLNKNTSMKNISMGSLTLPNAYDHRNNSMNL